MRSVTYSMSTSLDGYIAGPDGDFSWSAPDDDLHRFHNDQVRAVGVHLLGRRLYETMRYWDTALDDPQQDETGRAFAAIWQALPKIVFSSTLDEVAPGWTLATRPLLDMIAELREEDGGDLAIGGAGLASTALQAGLVDEVHAFVCPVIVGGGTPFLPPLDAPQALELVETRTFGGGVQYLHYRRAAA
jgi:dihydrofolate reductase